MTLNLGKSVVDYLTSHPEEKFSARQLAEWIFAAFPVECRAKKANSQALETDADLLQQLVAEIGSQRPRLQKKHPGLKTTEGRPRKYYFSEKSDSAEVAAVENSGVVTSVGSERAKVGEHGLYPLLASYLWAEFGVYTKRVDERRSSNKRGPHGNRWLYPDLVGMEDLGADWHQEVKDCVNQHSDKRTKLWSFEVKLLINRSNVRECFFQSVSNSSWSNFGYLVAAEIEGQHERGHPAAAPSSSAVSEGLSAHQSGLLSVSEGQRAIVGVRRRSDLGGCVISALHRTLGLPVPRCLGRVRRRERRRRFGASP